MFDLFHETLKFDLFPLTADSEDGPEQAPVKLGKRKRADTADTPFLPVRFMTTYIFQYLAGKSLLEGRQVRNFAPQIKQEDQLAAVEFCLASLRKAAPVEDWQQWFLEFQVDKFQKQIREFVSENQDVILSTHSKQVLNMLVAKSGNPASEVDLLFLLEHIHDGILTKQTSWDVSNTHLVIFMLIVLGFQLPADLVRTLEMQNGRSLVDALMVTPEQLRLRIELLENLQQPWISPREQKHLEHLKEKQTDLRQSTLSFLWVRAITPDVSGAESRLQCQGFEGLESHYTVIVMNDDKDIVEWNKLDTFHLAEMISDASPYFILIPKVPGAFLISSSSQYQNLCLLEDVRSLLSGTCCSLNMERQQRLTWIHPLAASRFSPPGSFSNLLQLLRIEKEYDLPKQYEICTIDRILMDEAKQVNLRDLPSFLFCCQSLAAQMKTQLGPDSIRFNDYFVLEAKRILRDLLRQQGLQVAADPADSAVSAQCEWVVESCRRVFNSIQIVQVIQALLILPFDCRRNQFAKDFKQQQLLKGQLEFWYYQLRDAAKAFEKTSDMREQISQMTAEIERLAQLKPAPEVQHKLVGVLNFVQNLFDVLMELDQLVATCSSKATDLQQVAAKSELLLNVLRQGQDLYYLPFHNILDGLLTCALLFAVAVRIQVKEIAISGK